MTKTIKMVTVIVGITVLLVAATPALATLTIGNNSVSSDGAYTLDEGTTTAMSLGPSVTSGTIIIGGTAQTGALTLASSSASSTLNLGVGSGGTTINLGTIGTNTIAIGNTTGTTGLTLQAGTGNIAINGTAAATITIGSAASTGTLTVGNSTAGQNINIGTAAGADTITIGNTSGATSVVINAGTGNINIGQSANVRTWRMGDADAAQTMYIGDNDGAVNLLRIGGVTSKVTLGGTVTISGNGPNYVTDIGSNNAIAAFLQDDVGTNVALSPGLIVYVQLAHSLQAGVDTFSLNAVSKNIKSHFNVANNIGTAYAATGLIGLMYDGTEWVDLSQ